MGTPPEEEETQSLEARGFIRHPLVLTTARRVSRTATHLLEFRELSISNVSAVRLPDPGRLHTGAAAARRDGAFRGRGVQAAQEGATRQGRYAATAGLYQSRLSLSTLTLTLCPPGSKRAGVRSVTVRRLPSLVTGFGPMPPVYVDGSAAHGNSGVGVWYGKGHRCEPPQPNNDNRDSPRHPSTRVQSVSTPNLSASVQTARR